MNSPARRAAACVLVAVMLSACGETVAEQGSGAPAGVLPSPAPDVVRGVVAKVVKAARPATSQNVDSTPELECETLFQAVGTYDYGGPLTGAQLRKSKRVTPQRIVKQVLRNPTVRRELDPHGPHGGKPHAWYTYDRVNPKKAKRVRVDFTSSEGALTGYLSADRDADHGWRMGGDARCSGYGLGPDGKKLP